MPETTLDLGATEVASKDTIRAFLRRQEESYRMPFLRWKGKRSATNPALGLNQAVFGEFDPDYSDESTLEVHDFPDVDSSNSAAATVLNSNTSLRPVAYEYAFIGGHWRRMLITRAAGPQPAYISKLVDLATAEWNWFGKQEYFLDGTRHQGKKEGDPDAAKRIDDEYWAKGAQVPDAGAWSAAFISYLMVQAGLSRAQFPISSAHRTYINAAVKLQLTGQGTIVYRGKELKDHEPQVGDLICGWYANSETNAHGAVTYQTAKDATRTYPSHCDLVVDKNGDEIITIGGNVGNSVTKKHYRMVGNRLTSNDPFSDGLFAILAHRFAELKPLPSVLPTHPDSFNINTNLKTTSSPLTAEKIRAFFASKPADRQALIGIGEAVMAAAAKYTINATYIVAHAILESGWGNSKYARDRFNLFGWGAVDSDPDKAHRFDSFAHCIDQVMGRINVLYLSPDGAHYRQAPVLGDTHHGMNVMYASDKEWGKKIAELARQIEAF